MGGTRTGSLWRQFGQAPLARPHTLRILPLGCLAGALGAFRPEKRNSCEAFLMFVVISRLDALSASMPAIGIALFDDTVLRWEQCTVGNVRYMGFFVLFFPPS